MIKSATLPWLLEIYITMNRIGGVMVSVLVSSAVDRGFENLYLLLLC